MLNFRKLKQDFSSSILKEGRDLHKTSNVISAKILKLSDDTIRLHAKILGNFDNAYESEIEIDRFESQTIHSNCDCSYRYDCQHLAALIYYLEEKIDSLLVLFSKENGLEKDQETSDVHSQELLETIREAQKSELSKKDEHFQKQVLQEYQASSDVLAASPFFSRIEETQWTEAELAVVFHSKSFEKPSINQAIEFQLALRLPFRSKPLQVANLKHFFEALRYEEPLYIQGKRYFLSLFSFDEVARILLKTLMDSTKVQSSNMNDRTERIGILTFETFGLLLAKVFDFTLKMGKPRGFAYSSEEQLMFPYLYYGNLETRLKFSPTPAKLRFALDYISTPSAKILLKPTIRIDDQIINFDEGILFECSKPGMLYRDTYYRFPPFVKRMHLQDVAIVRDMTIPKPLFGTFVENSLPALKKYSEVAQEDVIDRFVTLPYAGDLQAKCELSYLDGELEAVLYFIYDKKEIPATSGILEYEHIKAFVTSDGILARNLIEEKRILEDLFQDFIFNAQQGSYIAKTEKKIVEFMTEVIPRNKHRIAFECPQNLMDQFVYDKTKFTLKLDISEQVGYYKMDLKVDGALKGVLLDLLWECVVSKRSFIELDMMKSKRSQVEPHFSKILVLDLERISKLVQLFDELGVQKLDCYTVNRPLWNLVTIDEKIFKNLPVQFSISKKLKAIRQQMIGENSLNPQPIPKEIQTHLRSYQVEGVAWLEKLRRMYLNGILADDMGLGKTVQAITAITQYHKEYPTSFSLIVCPTSLLYNWKEEIHRFNPGLKTVVVDGIPSQRKKILSKTDQQHVVITSYTLLQKDIEIYQEIEFAYVILDEAQHIKNRGTRNAKSVKKLKAIYRLVLTGTPIENSLEELWSLFDFLMSGFLSSFDRFMEKYLRTSGAVHSENIEYLKRKVSPFILRRMKADVLKDLPPVDEIVYHCQLTKVQSELYSSYAKSARDELVKLVKRDGFDKVQIHVLATLTRLKQICCHPAIFAKEKAEPGDSAKYEMLLELLQTLVEGGHKTVVFSQYTRMLHIIREDFKQRGIRFSYLDGTSKDRLQIVKDFNKDPNIPLFLVSLKAGGTGLNLVGADTVIHYDMWWNPAVENQATDRVHRIGQKKSVSSYKLITLNTIEEKIVEMQNRKKGLVKKVVSCDDEAIAKLTWEDVLELLKT